MKLCLLTKTFIRFFRLYLLIIAKNWKQLNCPSTRGQINRLWYIYMNYYSGIKRNALMCNNKEKYQTKPIMSSEWCQTNVHTHTHTFITMIWSPKINKINLWWQKSKTDVGEKTGRVGIWLKISWENFLGLWKCSIFVLGSD